MFRIFKEALRMSARNKIEVVDALGQILWSGKTHLNINLARKHPRDHRVVHHHQVKYVQGVKWMAYVP